MKHSVILIVIAFAAFAAGCIGQDAKDVNELFIKYAELSAETGSYQVHYSTNYIAESGGESVSLDGEMEIIRNADNSYFFYSFSDQTVQRTMESHVYNIDKTVYSCVWETGAEQKTCVKSGELPMEIGADPVQEREQLKALLDEGVVSLKYEGRRSVAGKVCDSILVNYDLVKIKEKTPIASSAADITYMQQTQCYETETGVPLLMDLRMNLAEAGREAGSTLATEATYFSLSPQEIKLPEDIEIIDLGSGVFSNLTLPGNNEPE